MAAELDEPFAATIAVRSPELLREFNRGGVLAPADIHVARTLGRLAEVSDERVLLAAAMAVRAPRMGHVCVDLVSAFDGIVTSESDVAPVELAWPEATEWIDAVAACTRLVDSTGEAHLPLRLDRTRLYLNRYWREEQALAASLAALADSPLRQYELADLGTSVSRLFPDPEDQLQRAAAASSVMRGLTVIAGGPGTGKTTTVARVVGLLCDRAVMAGTPAPLIGLCAPTGKAAARLGEAIQSAAAELPIAERARAQMRTVSTSTIHRLLGWLPGGRFRHNSSNRLPHDLIVVDETSMVPLSLMVRLIEAIRLDAQIVLVGDPDQLTAIEAGAVLRDIVGPAASGNRFGAGMRSILGRVTGDSWDAAGAGYPGARSFGDGVVVLRRGHRFGAAIGDLAEAIRLGDGDAAVTTARSYGRGPTDSAVRWIETEPDVPPAADALLDLRDAALGAYGSMIEAARAGDGPRALEALGSFRLLCAHRRGPYGVAAWTSQVERWLMEALPDFDPGDRGYPGRPLLITENDHELRLNNGDSGVIVAGAGAVFERNGELVDIAPSRLGSVETLYAMTIHKSQGSQFQVTAVLLPEPESPILTRELLYTAVTRARRRLLLIGSEASLRAAVARPVLRATGLRALLWRDELRS